MYSIIKIQKERLSTIDLENAISLLRKTLNYFQGEADLLVYFLNSAIDLVEDRTGKIYLDSKITVFYKMSTYEKIFELPYSNATAIDSVTVYKENGGEEAIASDYYSLIDGFTSKIKIASNYSFPSFNLDKSLKIVYTAGYGNEFSEIPTVERSKILMLAGHMFTYRLSIEEAVASLPKLFGVKYA